MTASEMIEHVAEINPEALTADGFEAAIVGYVERCGFAPVILYDVEKCLQILMDRDGMDEEEAREFMDYNVIGSYSGPGTPMFLNRP